MSTQEIANRLVELCRHGSWRQAQDELYSQDAASIEAEASPAFERVTKGIEGLHEKTRIWNEMVEEMHGIEVSDPLIADAAFAVTMKMDVTMKGRGRIAFNELCSYKVKDGKVVEESFS